MDAIIPSVARGPPNSSPANVEEAAKFVPNSNSRTMPMLITGKMMWTIVVSANWSRLAITGSTTVETSCSERCRCGSFSGETLLTERPKPLFGERQPLARRVCIV
jgi:hypothetical protein